MEALTIRPGFVSSRSLPAGIFVILAVVVCRQKSETQMYSIRFIVYESDTLKLEICCLDDDGAASNA